MRLRKRVKTRLKVFVQSVPFIRNVSNVAIYLNPLHYNARMHKYWEHPTYFSIRDTR